MGITRENSRDADRVAHDLASAYDLTLVADWGEADEGWRTGYWSSAELRTVRKAVEDLATALGSADRFAQHVGHVTIRQEDIPHRGQASKGVVTFTASPISIDTWTVVHELGHVWDAHHGWRLSKALEAHTGGWTFRPGILLRKWLGHLDEDRRWPGCNRFGYFYGGTPPAGSDANFSRKEDFAEAVTAYVYPAVAQSRVERFKDDGRYAEFLYYADYTRTRRWDFVDRLVKGEILVE